MQDGIKRSRGRPRAYDREKAVQAITSLFWRQGYSATSLDDISDATGMTRPSLYQAFGSKTDMYQQALEFFVSRMVAASATSLDGSLPPQQALSRFFGSILDIYFHEDDGLGCFVFCTTLAETNNQPPLREMLAAVIEQLDAALVGFFQEAQKTGQLRSATDAQTLALLVQALLQHIAIRARSGEKKSALMERVESALPSVLSAS